VILFSTTCVEGDLGKRMTRATEYIDTVIKTGNDASRTLLGITSEIINDNQILEVFEGRQPDLDEIQETLHQGLVQLIGAVDAGLFARADIIELTEHLRQLAYQVMLPESDSPESHPKVGMALAALAKMREAVADSGEPAGLTGGGLSDTLTRCLDAVLDNAVESLKAGQDPFLPFAMVWDHAGERTLQRSVSEEYEQAVRMAHDFVRSRAGEISAYGIAWSGYVTMEGTRYDAVLVEAAERGSDQAMLMALRYTPATDEADFQELGHVAMLEHRDNLISRESGPSKG
jgi:hypothetical protein